MLVSEIPALRAYWYPVAYSTDLTGAPVRAQLFGTGIVVWRDGATVRAAADECPHRGARLSQGWLDGSCLVCPYHGWAFAGDGACARIPQQAPGAAPPPRARLAPVHADERYGLVWLCVADEPRAPVPVLPELEDAAFTLVHELMEEWRVPAPRCIDNALDVSHLSFVHRNTVGNPDQPRMSEFTVTRQGTGITFTTSYTARVTEQLRRTTGLTGDTTTRTTRGELVQPLVFRGVLEYENGLRHVLYKTAAPIDDDRTLFCQFVARNDAPDEARRASMIAMDRAVQAEDKALLEGLGCEFPVDVDTEVHTRSDRMTLAYRNVLADLAAESGGVRPDATWHRYARHRRPGPG